MGGGGKGGSSGGSETFDYFGTCVALVGTGPVTALWAVILDGKQIYPVDEDTGEPLTEATRPELAGVDANGATVLDIPGTGDIRFYWGTETQLPDPVLNANKEGEVHPAYRGWCYLVLDDWLLGRERQEAPNLEVIVERRPCRLNADGSAIIHDALQDGQANPLAVVQESLLDPRFGFDLPASDLNAADWADALNTVAADARNFVSVLIDSQQTARSLAADLGDYGEFRVIANGRKFGAVAWRREGQDISPGSLPLITAGQLAEMPRVVRNLPASLPNQWQLIYSDRGRRYGRDAVRSALLDARAVPGGLRPDSVDRPFITIRGQAQGWLDSFISRRGRPRRLASLSVRRGFAAAFGPGDVFRLDVDLEPGGTQVLIVVRIDRIIFPAGNRPAQIEATEELSFAPVTVTNIPGTDATPLALPALPKWTRVLQMPPLLVGYDTTRLLSLMAREDYTTLGHGVFIRTTPEHVLLGWHRQLALRGTLVNNLPAWPAAAAADAVGELSAEQLAVDTTFDVRISRPRADGIRDEEFLLGADPGKDAANNNDLLAISVRCTNTMMNDVLEDSFGKFVEFMSIETTEDVTVDPATATNSTWRLGVLRERLGWKARALLAADPVEIWIVRRSDLPAWQHRKFILQTAPDAAVQFSWRLMPFNAFAARDVGENPGPEAPPNPQHPPGWRVWSFGVPAYAPDVEFLAPTPAENAVLTINADRECAAKVTDSDGNLSRVEVYFYNAANTAPDPVKVFVTGSSGAFLFDPPVTIRPTSEGTWRLEVRAVDTANMVTNVGRTYTVGTGGPKCLPPVLYTQRDTVGGPVVGCYFGKGTAGSQVFYSAVPLGQAVGAFLLWDERTIYRTIDTTFYFFARHTGLGLADSDTLKRNVYIQFGGHVLTPGTSIP